MSFSLINIKLISNLIFVLQIGRVGGVDSVQRLRGVIERTTAEETSSGDQDEVHDPHTSISSNISNKRQILQSATPV